VSYGVHDPAHDRPGHAESREKEVFKRLGEDESHPDWIV